jgi:hypothetical protein
MAGPHFFTVRILLCVIVGSAAKMIGGDHAAG